MLKELKEYKYYEPSQPCFVKSDIAFKYYNRDNQPYRVERILLRDGLLRHIVCTIKRRRLHRSWAQLDKFAKFKSGKYCVGSKELNDLILRRMQQFK